MFDPDHLIFAAGTVLGGGLVAGLAGWALRRAELRAFTVTAQRDAALLYLAREFAAQGAEASGWHLMATRCRAGEADELPAVRNHLMAVRAQLDAA